MKSFTCVALALPLQAMGSTTSPIAKVVSMLSDLQAKIVKEGDVAQKEFAEYSEWCEDRNRNLDFEIKTGKSQVEELNAAVAQEAALTTSLAAKIDELTGSLTTDEADLKAATQIRNMEQTDFSAEEKELVETVDILHRAIQILEREMHGGASMLQLQSAKSLVQALSVMVQAAMIGTSDAAKLTAFVQAEQKQTEDDGDESFGAPAAAVYQSQSGNIVETLQGLLDKADDQLDECRKRETASTHNYEMLKQSLTDQIKFGNKDLTGAKKDTAGSAERKATAEGDLKVTSKELASDVDVKGSLHQNCLSRAQEFEAETKSRGEELSALAQAKTTIKEATGASLAQNPSFLQVDRSHLVSGVDLANFEVVRLIRDLARKENSPALAQLASRMSSMMHSGDAADPFGKVKSLITDMIAHLEKDAGADASKKAYCDKEIAETSTKKVEKTAEIEKLTTRIDQASARSAKLKEEVAALQNQLAKLAKAQAEADNLRREEHGSYTDSKAEQEKGLEGVKMALNILKEYYASDAAHDAASGAASGIIGLLETVESDMTKTLAALMTQEESAASEYESMTKKNEIERAAKVQDVRYKVKDSKQLDKTAQENTADRSTVQAELDAILEYWAKIQEQCVEKAELYSERKRRREAEIAGLKQALDILESETALLQQTSKGHRSLLRGHTAAHTK